MPFYVYILTTRKNTILYTGMTSDLARRMEENRTGLHSAFTKKYACDKLVHAEETSEVDQAVARERWIKRWRRAWKIELIEKTNPNWEDLAKYL